MFFLQISLDTSSFAKATAEEYRVQLRLTRKKNSQGFIHQIQILVPEQARNLRESGMGM